MNTLPGNEQTNERFSNQNEGSLTVTMWLFSRSRSLKINLHLYLHYYSFCRQIVSTYYVLLFDRILRSQRLFNRPLKMF